MIKTLIADDEPLARKRLRRLLGAFSDISLADEAENGCDAVRKIETIKPDLLLLDIQMPDLDGFGVLRMLETDTLPLAIFVTAYDQYAIDAFEVNAIDYLLKPIRPNRLEQAISKARERLASKSAASDHVSRLLDTGIGQPKQYIRRLPVRTQNRLLILGVDEITSLRIDRGLVFVTSPEGEFWTKYTTFSQLETQLDPNVFIRVHRQSIVNLNKIREVKSYDNSTARLILCCGHEVVVSRAQMKQLREALGL
ncbi:MAG TPA: response regulator [Blastocatellia bacterium]|nr:response regulator [Blastocatellia bacterium]